MSNTMKLLLMLTISSIVMTGWSYYQQNQPETEPLIPMMRMLLADMQQVDHGVYTENYALIKKGADGIANHPTMSQEDKQLVKETLGTEIKQFVEFDMKVHHHADSMRLAAIEKDMQDVLHHYRIVQQGCVDCHSNYRSQISKARKQ